MSRAQRGRTNNTREEASIGQTHTLLASYRSFGHWNVAARIRTHCTHFLSLSLSFSLVKNSNLFIIFLCWSFLCLDSLLLRMLHAWKPATKDNNQLSAFHIFRSFPFYCVLSAFVVRFNGNSTKNLLNDFFIFDFKLCCRFFSLCFALLWAYIVFVFYEHNFGQRSQKIE